MEIPKVISGKDGNDSVCALGTGVRYRGLWVVRLGLCCKMRACGIKRLRLDPAFTTNDFCNLFPDQKRQVSLMSGNSTRRIGFVKDLFATWVSKIETFGKRTLYVCYVQEVDLDNFVACTCRNFDGNNPSVVSPPFSRNLNVLAP